MAGEALHAFEDPNTGLDTHQETTDEILSRLDDAALRDLAENGDLDDVRAVVMSLVAENPSLEQYLIDFQQQNDTALVAELRREAANDLTEPTIKQDPNTQEEHSPEESEMQETIEAAQKYLYESLDIDENQANNGVFTNFAKGIVDTLIFENAELAVEVIETRGGVILDALKELATWNGIKQMMQALGESIWDLFGGSAYEKGKAVADLGLIATGVGVTATVGRKALRTVVRNLERPSAHNLDRALIDDIAKLPDTERLEAAGVFLGRDIPETQRQAILDAHNFGERGEDGSYSLGDLREKTRILREAGLTSGEIRTLFDNNICGKEFPEFPNIYEDPRFDYLATDEYASIREVLGEDFSASDIIGEGANAIIFKDPTNPDVVLKVAKPGNTDELLQEFQTHQAFSAGLRDLQAKYAGTPEGEMLNQFTIPQAMIINEDIGILQMDRVEGHTFRTLTALEFNKDHIGRVFPDGVEGLSDFQIDERLRAEGLRVYYRDSEEMYNIQDNLDDWGEVVELEIMYERGAEKQVRPFFDLMKREGYDHFDSHWGNIMMGSDGRIHLIDFGRSRLTNN